MKTSITSLSLSRFSRETKRFTLVSLLSLVAIATSSILSFGQTPTLASQPLPYVPQFDGLVSAYPSGFSVSRGISLSYKTDLSSVESFPDADFTDERGLVASVLVAPLTNSLPGTNISGGSRPQYYDVDGKRKLLISLSSRIWGAFMSVSTNGNNDIKISYSLQLTERGLNNSTAGLNLVAFLQYRTSTVTGWTTVENSFWNTSTLGVGDESTFNLTLPSSLNNLSNVDFRIVNYQTGEVTIDDLLSYAISNVSVTGTQFEVPVPTALSIKSVLPANTSVLTDGKPFNVTVEIKDQNGDVIELTSATGISISAQGAGSLSSSPVTINGVSSAVISNSVYTGNGVVTITASAISGQTLTSASFVVTIVSDPLAGLRTLFFEDFESVGSLAAKDNHPTSVVGFSSINADGEALDPAGSPQYGSAGFVITRTSRGAWNGNNLDNIGISTFFDNENSVSADSTFIAAATSYFVSTTANANRVLILPLITMDGTNLELSWQAMSRGSYNFRDSYRLLAAEGAITSIDDLQPVPNADFQKAPSRRVDSKKFSLPTELEGKVITLAFQLYTPAPGGDRLFFDNIRVTSGGTISTKAAVESKSLSVYPNPASSTISVDATVGATVSISDLSGTSVLVKTIDASKTVDVSGLAAGFYVVKVSSSTGVKTAKVVIK